MKFQRALVSKLISVSVLAYGCEQTVTFPNRDAGRDHHVDVAFDQDNVEGGECLPGYQRKPNGLCEDLDECALGTSDCDARVACTNTLGSFVCGVCPTGYQGDGRNGEGHTGCVDVNECLVGNGGCDVLTTCTNSGGARSCSECPSGYSGSGETECTDVDECASNNGGCDSHTACTNTLGGRTCGVCPSGFTGDGLNGCVDINECASNNGGCDPRTSCTNSNGGRTCGTCPTGYSGDGVSGCQDINECLTGNGGCTAGQNCSNTAGSFSCSTCPNGFTSDGQGGCRDINECQTDNGGCDPRTTCSNTQGGRTCGVCPSGYAGDGISGCRDINECLTNNGGCDLLSTCNNTAGGRTCGTCPSGYSGNGTTGCLDVNECLTDNGGCDELTTCNNTAGSRMCGTCPSGYTGNGTTGCLDVNECLTGNGLCDNNAACSNTAGDWDCTCNAGYSGDGFSCTLTSCAIGLHICRGTCVSNNAVNHCGASCVPCALAANAVSMGCDGTSCRVSNCLSGYQISGDQQRCDDINECLTSNGGCHANAACANTPGSRTCVCNSGFTGDGLACMPMVLEDWQVDSFIKASNTRSLDEFGFSVALSIDGSTLAVGAQWEGSSPIGDRQSQSGAVYVYTRSSGQWSQQAFLKASNTDSFAEFGHAVALSSDGNTLAVGAAGENTFGRESGAAYVFSRTNGNWAEQAFLKAWNAGASDWFGSSVALSRDGNTLAVGAIREDSSGTGVGSVPNNSGRDSGAVYVFVRTGADWDQQAFIKASNSELDDEFGLSVALSSDGNTLAVGANSEDSATTGVNSTPNNLASNSGAVYVFIRTGVSWAQQAYIKPSNTGADDRFGAAVALSNDGNTLAVGASTEDGSATGINGISNESASNSGAVYVFTRTGSSWTQQAYIKASNTGQEDWFGRSVSLSSNGDILSVGARYEGSASTGINGTPNESAGMSGAVYVFTRTGGSWSHQSFVKASNTGPEDRFGWSVALSGDGTTLAVGAIYEDSSTIGVNGTPNESASNSGAVYTYQR